MAVDFESGSSQYLAMGSDSALDDIWAGGGTITTWIKLESIPNFAMLTAKRAGGTGWDLITKGSGGANALQLDMEFTTTDGAWRTPDNSLSTGVWIHCAILYNSDSSTNDAVIYLDGVSQSITEDTPSGTSQSGAANNLNIARRDDGNYYDGLIEDFRVFKGVSLTQEQVSLLASGYRGPIGGETGWWSMEDFEALAHPDGSTLTAGTHLLADKSVNDNMGDPTGSPVAVASDAPQYRFWQIWGAPGLLEQVMAGIITNTGAVQISMRKILAGVITNTGVLILQTMKVVAGRITNVGSLVRKVRKIVVGSMTNTGSLFKRPEKIVAGFITNTGAFKTMRRKVISFIIDRQIDVDMSIDVSLVNTEE